MHFSTTCQVRLRVVGFYVSCLAVLLLLLVLLNRESRMAVFPAGLSKTDPRWGVAPPPAVLTGFRQDVRWLP